jgi:hypothetical protein
MYRNGVIQANHDSIAQNAAQSMDMGNGLRGKDSKRGKLESSIVKGMSCRLNPEFFVTMESMVTMKNLGFGKTAFPV